MLSHVLHTMSTHLKGERLDEPLPGASHSRASLGDALHSAERDDARGLVAAMRGISAEDHDMVLKHVVLRALARGGSLNPLLAMTMLLPQRADAHCGIGFAYLLRESYAAAHRSFRCALALEADSILALLGCGVALQNLGQPRLAMEFLSRVLERDKDGQAGHAAAAAMLRLLDDTDTPVPPEPADCEAIPYVPGTANGIIIY